MFINDKLDSGRVHRQRLAEGTGFAHEYATALAQRPIEGFDNARLPFALRTGSVLPAWQPLGVGFPEASEVPAVAAIPLR